MKTKLIMLEGIPGSGKTTTSQYISELLSEKELYNDLYIEGNINHPADFEGIACLTENQYREILSKYTEFADIIESISDKGVNNNIYEITYMKYKDVIPNSLLRALEQYDVYHLPNELYCQLLLERWESFSDNAKKESKITIFDCAFLQNPINTLLARDDLPVSDIKRFIFKLADIIKDLNPVIIYYYQDNIGESVKKIKSKRSTEWFERSIWYYTKQKFGEVRNLNGLEGVIHYLEIRKQVELEIVNSLTIDKLLLNNSSFDWESMYKEIRTFMETKL
ncbi:hypothetical protein [Chengkuizengella axinellae]|uniref:Uncharacterized protein n=1 Tax=Chengkuizengella axinellae TaxID=3064388 RepID=A0ABT9IUD4_9BACL|nr:hypothetical protein [Chengkuizengella sp. 2205SS18-9]MDP5272946.1 hypothetical protein [Chengkuizengella sp. 2205SS18-9]